MQQAVNMMNNSVCAANMSAARNLAKELEHSNPLKSPKLFTATANVGNYGRLFIRYNLIGA